MKQFSTATPIQGSEKLYTYAAAARQQQPIIRMMTSSRTAAVRPCWSQARLYVWQCALVTSSYRLQLCTEKQCMLVPKLLQNMKSHATYIYRHLQLPWVTSNSGFKVTVLFKGKYLKTVHFRDKVTIGRYQEAIGRQSNGTSFDDL